MHTTDTKIHSNGAFHQAKKVRRRRSRQTEEHEFHEFIE